MKLLRFLPCVLAACVLWSGCAATPPPGAGQARSVPEESPAPDAPLEEGPPPEAGGPPLLPEGDVPEGTVVEYTQEQSVVVDGGRGLSLRLRCLARATGYGTWNYGVTGIEVLEGGELLQALSVGEAIAEEDRGFGIERGGGEESTHCWDADGNLIVEDLNFDGAGDLRLLECTGVVNSAYLCWLWDPEAEGFFYAFSLYGYDVVVDPEAEQIITTGRDTNVHTTEYYQYGEDGLLRLVDSECVEATLG